MIFDKPNCPECGAKAKGTLETLQACADLDFADDGTAEYNGYTDVYWDSQKSVVSDDPSSPFFAPTFTLICPEGHEWQSVMKP
jgi:hypothetical protein